MRPPLYIFRVKELLYEGKSKQVYKSDRAHEYILKFKNSATAFNAQKKAEFEGKGRLNQAIATMLFQYLEKNGVKSHFIESLDETHMRVQAVTIIPVEVVVRNRAAGSLIKRVGIEEKTVLNPPLVEFFFKNDALGDPHISEDHIYLMKWATPEDVKILRSRALEINQLLKDLFDSAGLILADFKLEFGKNHTGEILLSDEISPDGCRLWDKKTQEVLDKDRFRKDLGDLVQGYQKVYDQLKKQLTLS